MVDNPGHFRNDIPGAQHARVLNPAGGEDDQPRPDEAAAAVRAPDLVSVHSAGILVCGQVDRRRVKQQGHIRRVRKRSLEVVALTVELRGRHVAEA